MAKDKNPPASEAGNPMPPSQHGREEQSNLDQQAQIEKVLTERNLLHR
jgi:hypothetical protein